MRKTDVARIADLPPLPKISCNEYDAGDVCNDSLDLGGAEVEPPIRLKQTEFSVEQSAIRIW